MRRVLLGLAALVIARAPAALSAQAPVRSPAGAPQLPAGRGEVRGTVVEATSSAPVPRASVAVRAKGDGSLVAGAIAGPDGAFRIQGLRTGSYLLRVTYLGFAPQVQQIAIADAAPTVDVGAVKLARVAVSLQGVSVTEERNTVSVEPDRNAYRAKAVAPAATNASEVLDAVPSVQVDGDGKVSLRGNENVAIQINGRPSPIRGAQLAGYLKSLPANVVERVEVIPNPSAREDPEGMAGIINIVLKQNADLGLSTGLNVSAANADRYNASGNVGYQVGRVTLFTNGGINVDRRPVFGINDRERIDALSAPLSYTEQDISGDQSFRGQNLNATLDYKLNARDVLSNAVTLNHRGGDDASVLAYSELSGTRALTDRYDRTRGTDTKGLFFDYDLAFRRTYDAKTRHELAAEVRFNRAHDEETTHLWRYPLAAGAAGARLEGEQDETDALTRQYVAQLDYTRPLGKRGKLETGYKGNLRQLARDYTVLKDPAGSGAWTRSDLSNAFDFDEQVQAAYAVVSQGVGRFDLQGGLRAEYAERTFDLSSARYPYVYRSLYPSAVVSYNATPLVQYKTSYSRRVRRPGTQELNPFPSFFDIQNVFLGNPNLSPEYTDALELGITRNGKLGMVQLAPFFRHTSNIIRVDINTADTVDGREVTSVSFKNLATSDSWGADVNGSLRLGKRLNGFAGFNVFKMVTDGGSTSSLGSNAVTWSTRVNASSELTPSLTVQGSYFYRAPMKIEKGQFDAFHMTSLSVRRKLRGDQAVATLRMTDPFGMARFRIKAGDDHVVQLTERNFGMRSTFVGLQLTYGRPPRVRQPRPDEQQQGSTGFGP